MNHSLPSEMFYAAHSPRGFLNEQVVTMYHDESQRDKAVEDYRGPADRQPVAISRDEAERILRPDTAGLHSLELHEITTRGTLIVRDPEDPQCVLCSIPA